MFYGWEYDISQVLAGEGVGYLEYWSSWEPLRANPECSHALRLVNCELVNLNYRLLCVRVAFIMHCGIHLSTGRVCHLSCHPVPGPVSVLKEHKDLPDQTLIIISFNAALSSSGLLRIKVLMYDSMESWVTFDALAYFVGFLTDSTDFFSDSVLRESD